MTMGRLSYFPHWFKGWDYIVGSCGCKILTVLIGTFEWHDRRCVCDVCSHYVCKCYLNYDESQNDKST